LFRAKRDLCSLLMFYCRRNSNLNNITKKSPPLADEQNDGTDSNHDDTEEQGNKANDHNIANDDENNDSVVLSTNEQCQEKGLFDSKSLLEQDHDIFSENMAAIFQVDGESRIMKNTVHNRRLERITRYSQPLDKTTLPFSFTATTSCFSVFFFFQRGTCTYPKALSLKATIQQQLLIQQCLS